MSHINESLTSIIKKNFNIESFDGIKRYLFGNLY